MKKLMAILFTIMLAFSPMVSATPVLTEEALIIPVEDLEVFIQLFALLAQYDDLVIGAMPKIYNITEEMREKINVKIANDELDKETIDIFTSFYTKYSNVNGAASRMYNHLSDGYNYLSEVSFETLWEVLEYLNK